MTTIKTIANVTIKVRGGEKLKQDSLCDYSTVNNMAIGTCNNRKVRRNK